MSETHIPSPCVSICALDENDICVGCHRSGQEITEWSVMTSDEKKQVMKLVAERESAQIIG